MINTVAVLTSGGDAPGMNAAVRAVVRRGLECGLQVYGVWYGYEGLVRGGAAMAPLDWNDVGGILPGGGTFLGTARSQQFRSPEGRRQAVAHLLERGIEALVVIGGDGSLMGAHVLASEWAEHVEALRGAEAGAGDRPAPASLQVIGLPGSIDNDLSGTDMSIGVDTALNHIVRAIDDLSSTAASHQRTFVVETMGRQCGYLALMAALAGGASWVLVPEMELSLRWHQKMVRSIKRAREIGRSHQMVVVAEGARHPDGLPIRCEQLKEILGSRLGVDVRITVLGHVQRGGSPTAFDRILATRLGVAAIDWLVENPDTPLRHMLGLRRNHIEATPLVEVVEKSQAVGRHIENGNQAQARQLRGEGFSKSLELVKTVTRIEPAGQVDRDGVIGILTGGADAPGMNTAVSIAGRCLLNRGYQVSGVQDGFLGLLRANLTALEWNELTCWVNRPGSALGSARHEIRGDDVERIAATIRAERLRALIVIGGLGTYLNVQRLQQQRSRLEELNLPIIVVPATIDNNLPGTEFSIGCDTALNNIVQAVDKIRHTAGASKRAFIVEVMGRECGFLALMGAMASGAEKAYLPEQGIRLGDLIDDVRELRASFGSGKRMVIYLRNERASRRYTTDFIRRLLEEESQGLFEVRTAILGHLQRGGAPTAFDRIMASRMGSEAAFRMAAMLEAGSSDVLALGLQGSDVEAFPLDQALQEMELERGRPRCQWFLDMVPIADALAQRGPSGRR